jgi:hypothetical protein
MYEEETNGMEIETLLNEGTVKATRKFLGFLHKVY